ncbi:LacI family DNA-binding transcriptional regulator [Arthrobacter sp. RAF14]|uniref:LacI family DNA-binding transcriptional regulator n=1 Tax=Arthrobacter sp. RAF14 TaxID=3233051 RepID=UPI003F93760C
MAAGQTPQTPRRVTLNHVAERAGVSRSAASFVMSGRTDQRLSADVFARVRAAAEELGYKPNLTAKTLRTGRSGTVALVSDFVSTTSFASTMVRGALEELCQRDSLLFTVDTHGREDLESRLLDSLLARNIDGIIYASMFTRTVVVPPVLKDTPVVLLNCLSDDGGGVSVIPDEASAGEDAARLLLEAGHTQGIWFVGSMPPGQVGGKIWPRWAPLALSERRKGIDRTLENAGTSLAGSVIVDNDWDIANGRAAVADLLTAGERPKALICANDAVAIGASHAVRAAGLRIPADISLVSFDGTPLAQASEPALTTIALPHLEMGRRAASLLSDTDRTPRCIRIAMPVIPGGSITRPRLGL